MGQIAITREDVSGLTKRERLVVVEIGRDMIDSASAFVSYMSEAYGFSKSSVWYNLKRLKEKGVLDFATKDELGKPLVLTRAGLAGLTALERMGFRIEVADATQLPMPNDPQPDRELAVVERNRRGGAVPNLIIHPSFG